MTGHSAVIPAGLVLGAPATRAAVPAQSPDPPWTVDRAVEAATRYLVEHLGEPITLRDMSRVAAMSTYHFSRMFRARMGVPPHRYLMLLRLERATELLRETDLAVSQIAWRVGFKAVSHFISTFRTRFDATPLQYRRRVVALEQGLEEPAGAPDRDHPPWAALDARRPCPYCGRVGSPFG